MSQTPTATPAKGAAVRSSAPKSASVKADPRKREPVKDALMKGDAPKESPRGESSKAEATKTSGTKADAKADAAKADSAKSDSAKSDSGKADAAKAAGPVTFDTFLAKLGARDRTNIERHIAACETQFGPRHAANWKRIALGLASLAPHAGQTTGQQVVQFFVPDGKYRMQIFAMEDQRDGTIIIYATDATKEAIKAGIIRKPKHGGEEENDYGIGNADETLRIELLDAVNTPNPAPYYKHMLGWNRKALRISLPSDASTAQLIATEQLCALSAKQYQGR